MKISNPILVALLFLGVACSSSEDAVQELIPGGGGNNNPTAFSLASGTYQSDCIAHPFGGMRMITIDTDGTDVALTTVDYRGDTCDEEYDREELNGSFEDYGASDGVNLVRYKIPVGDNGGYTWRFYNMQVEADKITMSDSFGNEDEADSYPVGIELNKQ